MRFEFAFPTCSELNQCVQAIKKAKAEAPNFVRLAGGKFFELAERSIDDCEGGHIRAELEFQSKVDQWKKELDCVFEEQRAKAEEKLGVYFETRMAFMEQLRAQMESIPRRTSVAAPLDEEYKQLREHLRLRFVELERFEAQSLVKLAELAQRVRDGDLLSMFNDLRDFGVQSGQGPAESSSDESPAGQSGSSEKRQKPKRFSTYLGTVQRKRNFGGSSNSTGAIRRHTTVPGNRGPPVTSSKEEERDEKSRLPLRFVPSRRRVAGELIRENLRLRTCLDQLTN